MSAVAEVAYGLVPLFEAEGREPTLDDLIAGVWEGLARRSSEVRCPVCGNGMEPEYGAHALPVGGKCVSCGSTLH